MVKVLIYSPNYTSAKNLDVEDLSDIDYFSTVPVIDSWPDQMRIQLRSNALPQDYFPVGPLRLVSDRLMKLCVDYGVHAEFLPIQLLGKDGAEMLEKFYFCHLLDCVDCFDAINSQCTYRDSEKTWIDELLELAIYEEKAVGHHLFRVDLPAFVIAASDEFAKSVESHKMNGPIFIEPKEWSVSS